MLERLSDYKNKCKVLKQIQSNKARFYNLLNNIQNFLTVFVSAFITFIGFSGMDKIKKYVSMVMQQDIDINNIEMFFNILVFILFFVGVVHLVFQFSSKQTESEKAITLLSSLINDIDNILDNSHSQPSVNSVELITDKYTLITQIIPTNTDKEYLRAKKSLKDKVKEAKTYEIRNNLTLSEKEQEDYIIKLLEKCNVVQRILSVLSNQQEELYLGGGIIRNIVWDDLHGYSEMTPIEDIDVIYYDVLLNSREHDIAIENRLKNAIPNLVWSVKNQARMHTINNDEPYTSLQDAISKWPETVSAMLVRKESDGKYKFIAPYKYDDLFRLIVLPTPHFMVKIDKYKERVLSKRWKEKWEKIKILYIE